MANVDDDSITNQTTDEQLLISKKRRQIIAEPAPEPEDQGLAPTDQDLDVIEIKRSKKGKKNALDN